MERKESDKLFKNKIEVVVPGSDLDAVIKAYEMTNKDETADYITELLLDDGNSTYKMFEELATKYITASEDERNGIDYACSVLLGWSLVTVSRNLLTRKNINMFIETYQN